MNFNILLNVAKTLINSILKRTISAPSNHVNDEPAPVEVAPAVVWRHFVKIIRVTSPFGWRNLMGSDGKMKRQYHNGTDYTGINTHAQAPCACIIKEVVSHDTHYPYKFIYDNKTKTFKPADYPPGRAWTPYVVFQAVHDSNLQFIYRHGECLVPVGKIVEAGEPFYKVDNYGFSQGAHLHVECKYKGKEIDPDAFIKEKLNVA